MIAAAVIIVFSTNFLPGIIVPPKISDEYAYETTFPVARPTQNVNKKTDCKGAAMCITGEVTKIVDGDTIHVLGKKIRLALVDTPEINQPGFGEAADFTRRLCPVGSSILVDQDDGQIIDKYGRIIAKVTCSGMNLNEQLLENDHAIMLTGFCDVSEFSSESWAKKFGCRKEK